MTKIKVPSIIVIALIALMGLGAEAHAQGAATDVDCRGCVDTRDIGSKAVTEGKLAPGSVTSRKIVKKAVTGAKIADEAVTVDKVEPALKNAIDTFCLPGESRQKPSALHL